MVACSLSLRVRFVLANRVATTLAAAASVGAVCVGGAAHDFWGGRVQ
jgi:hypothetical protein